MMNNLGKIIVFLCLVPYILYAKVTLSAPETFYKHDVVTFKIVATGKDINIPEITQIDGNPVQTIGTSQQTTIVNADTTYQLIKSYAILSHKDIVIPSFDVTIDNKIEKTDKKRIKMLEVTKTKSELYDLTIDINKKNVYVGESVEFTLKFRYKKDLEIVSLDYTKPTFDGFWVKEPKQQKKPTNDLQNGYIEQDVKYILFPQKAGDIELGALKIGVTTLKGGSSRGYFLSSPTQTVPVYSNKVHLKVEALPKGVNLVGDFQISSSINKNRVKQGEAVSYKLEIKGRGNIDDLDEIKLDIPKTTIYDNPSKKEFDVKNNLYGGKYTKSYSIVSTDDFKIPSIELKYFDKDSKTVKTIKTKSYEIKVDGEVKQNTKLEVTTPKNNQLNTKSTTSKERFGTTKLSYIERGIYFIFGFLFAIILIVLCYFIKIKKSNKNELPLIKLVKKSKNADELFKLLLVYINIDEELDKIIYKLEKLPSNEYKQVQKNVLKLLDELGKKDIQLDTRL